MWYELCENSEAIASLYDGRPLLNPVEVHEITFHCDGPSVRLRFNLPTFPERPPRRWEPKANTAQMTLELFGVEHVEFNGWGTSNVGTLQVEKRADGRLDVAFESESVHLRLHCLGARIVGISGYINGLLL